METAISIPNKLFILAEEFAKKQGLSRNELFTYNFSRIATVIILNITRNIRLADIPGNLSLKSEESGLTKESVVNVSQIVTIDKSLPENKVGSLSRDLMEEVDYGLGLVLGLN